MRGSVVQGWVVRFLVAVLLVLSSAPTWASPAIEPGGPGEVYLPVVLKQANSDQPADPVEPDDPGEPDVPDEPDDPGPPDGADEIPGFEFALDPDGQPVERLGVQRGSADEIVQVIVQLADAPLTAYQGGIMGLPATKPVEGQSLDVQSSAASTYAAYLEEQRAGFEAQLASTVPDAVIVREFSGTVLQGMAMSVRRDQIASVERLPGVKRVMVAREHRPLLEFSLPLINAPEFWSQLGGPSSAGAGQRIAIIDTGIDIDNPFFNDTGFSAPSGFPKGYLSFTNRKVIVARAYFTGVENPCGAGNPITPRDFHGHGTHVAGIAAGNYNTPAPGTLSAGTLSGVAPRAFLMSYNVFPCGVSSASDIDVIAAIEDAVADGATVININLGNPFVGRIEDDLLVQAVENAVAANVVVSIAAGNEGYFAETVGSPGIAPNAITVGASTTEARPGHAIHVMDSSPVPSELLNLFALEGAGPSLTSDLIAPYISLDQPFIDSTACETVTTSLAGQIALIKRGGCSLGVKVRNVANAGAIAAVIYNHLPGQGPMTMPDQLEGITIPSFLVSNYAGLALENWFTSHSSTARMRIEASFSWFGTLADAVARFSARGPNPDWAIKPDIVAPGVDILSTTQDDALAGCCTDPSGYARLSGTSASAAHVAGVAALVRQRWSWLSAQALKSALMTTAKLPVWQSDDYTPPLAQVMDRGAGRIDLGLDLVSKSAFIYPPSHSFGSHNVGNGPVTVQQPFTLSPWTSNQTWRLTVVEAVGHPDLEVTVSPSQLYVSCCSKDFTLTVRASVTVPPGEYEGFVKLTSGTGTLHVPYWIRIVNVPIPLDDILLVDDDRDSEEYSAPPPFDCSANYISTLNNLGRRFTRWDTLLNGTPTQADMERASAVIWFTCRYSRNNLNFLAPIEGTEATELLNYLEAGGRLFITGQEIAHGSAPSFVAGLGAGFCSDSIFNIYAPPRPSVGGARNASSEPIAGGMEFDITPGGDGTGFPIFIDEIEVLGESTLPILFALSPNYALCQGVVGVTDASEPTLEAPQEYLGRSVYLSFDFDDVNNNTGFSTRETLLRNILNWLTDEVSVVARCAVDGRTVDCAAAISSSGTPATFRWDLGDGTILSTRSSPSVVHRYSAPGTFTIRVEATDSLGHKALDDAVVTIR